MPVCAPVRVRACEETVVDDSSDSLEVKRKCCLGDRPPKQPLPQGTVPSSSLQL